MEFYLCGAVFFFHNKNVLKKSVLAIVSLIINALVLYYNLVFHSLWLFVIFHVITTAEVLGLKARATFSYKSQQNAKMQL